jgi:hypothetical protein
MSGGGNPSRAFAPSKLHVSSMMALSVKVKVQGGPKNPGKCDVVEEW